MQIKIGNVMAAFSFIGSFYVLIKFRPQVIEAISCIARTGPSHSLEDKLIGCIAIGLIILGIVSSIRLIISERQK
ncbi:MAG: hypothetical protein COA78_07765 [Blastopirellula sp.]|nr:MAG: hypothetical protein COA78_07765 [Blastopirellula sp.]